LASGSGTTLADIYIEKDMPEKSKYYIDVSLENIRISGKTERLRHLYPVMSKYYAEVGKPEMAKAYVDSTLAAKKRYGKKTSSIQLLRLEQKEAKRREEQMRLEQEKKDARRNALISILIVVGVAAAAVGIVSHKKMKANQKLKSYQLEMAKYQLDRFSKTIEKNNILIATLKKEKKEDASHETIQKLRQSSLLTDESWEEFQDHFNQIFPGFIQRLKTKYPSLTPTEIRYLVLAKLGFSNNKTASALGVSPSSLRVTWHRMKKKLKLSHASPKALMAKIS
jgi:DNA-binding CsgD family transcriptional regulator